MYFLGWISSSNEKQFLKSVGTREARPRIEENKNQPIGGYVDPIPHFSVYRQRESDSARQTFFFRFCVSAFFLSHYLCTS
jgi:hypothetical protein